MNAETTVRDYYAALRAGESLGPFFAEGANVVKVGIGERLVGSDAVREGLREQTRTTAGWEVESRDLRVTEGEGHAWFADEVFMGWSALDRGIRYEFDTRWSGTLERDDGDWRFVGMHVSCSVDGTGSVRRGR
jgi:hypothetical protein